MKKTAVSTYFIAFSSFSDYDYDQNNPSGDRPHDAQQLQRAQSPPPICRHGHAHLWQVAVKELINDFGNITMKNQVLIFVGMDMLIF